MPSCSVPEVGNRQIANCEVPTVFALQFFALLLRILAGPLDLLVELPPPPFAL